MSGINHPQSDGHTELTSRSLSNLLRCLIGDTLRTWDSKLPQAEFAHNHATNRSIGFSPFQVIYGTVPRGPVDLTTLPDRTRSPGDAATFVESLAQVHSTTHARLEEATTKYKQAADKHRRRLVFDVGGLVWVYLTRDKLPAHTYNKLKSKKNGPVEFLERINDNAYRLRLPDLITTSDVFNVKFLSRYVLPPTLLIRGRILLTRGVLMQQHLHQWRQHNFEFK